MIPISIKKSKVNKKFFGEFQSPDLLAKHPLIGIIMFLLGTLTFSILAYYVHQRGSLVQWDLVMENHMHKMALNSPSWIKYIMFSGFYIGLQGYMVIGVLMSIYFLIKKFWKEFFIVIILYAGQSVLFYFLTRYFARPRPQFTQQLAAVIKYPSFPSGHSMSGVICFGLLAYFIVPKIVSGFRKAVVIIFAVLMILFICYSRFFMGAHYLT